MSYCIRICSRGEELVYTDADGEFHFDVSSGSGRATVHCSSYWNGAVGSAPVSLPPAKARQILPRIEDYFSRKGEAVSIACLTPEDRLPEHHKDETGN